MKSIPNGSAPSLEALALLTRQSGEPPESETGVPPVPGAMAKQAAGETPVSLFWQPVEAVVEDLPQLCDLLAELFTQESDFKADREKQMAGLRLILDNPRAGRIFVLRSEGIVVGMVSLLFTVSTCHGGFVIVLEDLIVHRDYRGRGAATALLKHAMGYARAIDAMRITLLTDPWNEPAIRLYLKHGFVTSPMSVMRWHA